MLNITNEDNMTLMSIYPDKYFDLAIVDPPYGSDNIEGSYRGGVSKQKKYNEALWEQDSPSIEYFNQLVRVSKNQIIWGANHFIQNIPNANSSCWVVWNKKNGENSFADCELAYCSFSTSVRLFDFKWQGMLQQDMKNKEVRIHPTQKPVVLYKWLLEKYAKPGDKILDTHLGSGSIAIACHDYGYDLTACELDPDYYKSAMLRIKQHTAQTSLFKFA